MTNLYMENWNQFQELIRLELKKVKHTFYTHNNYKTHIEGSIF